MRVVYFQFVFMFFMYKKFSMEQSLFEELMVAEVVRWLVG
jgi:hypothetical protein